MQKLFYTLILCSFLFAGCDNKDLLQSEKKIKEQLENKNWKRIGPHPNEEYESWTFKEGNLMINKADTVLNGSYTVDTKFSSSYVSFTGFPSIHNLFGLDFTNLNTKWTIAEIKDKVLYLSATNESGTIKSLEFVVQ